MLQMQKAKQYTAHKHFESQRSTNHHLKMGTAFLSHEIVYTPFKWWFVARCLFFKEFH